MTSHVVVLSGFRQSRHLIRLVMTVQYHENVDDTYIISNVIILSIFSN